MADRIENNLPAQSDAAYVRALDNSGNYLLLIVLVTSGMTWTVPPP